MRKGFWYLVAVMDWHSRKVLSRCLSNSLDTTPCIEALDEALAAHGIQISMDGKGRWMDNGLIERPSGAI